MKLGLESIYFRVKYLFLILFDVYKALGAANTGLCQLITMQLSTRIAHPMGFRQDWISCIYYFYPLPTETQEIR